MVFVPFIYAHTFLFKVLRPIHACLCRLICPSFSPRSCCQHLVMATRCNINVVQLAHPALPGTRAPDTQPGASHLLCPGQRTGLHP